MRTVVIIPARYASNRFPGKPLVPLLGKPMVLWVAELSAKAVGADNVFVATEDKRIADVVEKAGFGMVMTSDDCLTGTDRLAEASTQIDADIYINVQGDEPLVNPGDINKAIQLKQHDMGHIYNAYCWMNELENPDNVNIPKVITNEKNKLIYMSRQPLPGFKSENNKPKAYKKQVCIYAFTKDELLDFKNFGRKSVLEYSEDIEILRFLELDRQIYMFETQASSLAVDVPTDIPLVENALKQVHGL